jgi:prophage maintenance system killer protein
MDIFLVLNRLEITTAIDRQERIILALAASELERAALTD